MSGASKAAMLLVAALAVGVGAYLLTQTAPTPPPEKPKAEPNGPVGDAERAAYIQQHIKVSDIEIGQDAFEDVEGEIKEVPGLLAVSGKVKNDGPRPIADLKLVIKPTGNDGKVLGSYIQDISGGRPLEAGQSRLFKFTVPDKKDWDGKFLHALQ